MYYILCLIFQLGKNQARLDSVSFCIK